MNAPRRLVALFCCAVAAAFLLVVADARRAVAQEGARAAQEAEPWWCVMRGKPCDLVDHAAAGNCPQCGMALQSRSAVIALQAAQAAKQKTVGVVLYPGFELLDACGPLEMWGNVAELRLVTVSQRSGRVNSIQGVALVADHSFADCPELDLLMVPGGMGTLKELENEAFLAFLRERSERAELTTSVCSGSALLAKAGLLDGRKATSNKLWFDLAVKQSGAVEWVYEARWVDDGEFVTSSGVSAGMDMALHVIERLYGKARAEQVAAWTEYQWHRDPSVDPFAKKR